VQQTQVASVSPMQTQMPTTTVLCQQNQLSGSLSAQGAAGNIYAKLILTNISKTSCEITLGNTISATFAAKNIVIHNQQTVPAENFLLTQGAKVYSQIHYPNGPQCQSSISPQPVTFAYKTAQTSLLFVPDEQTGKLQIQACSSSKEKTTIDIWPLSKNPITP
jgi:hypothetical protein